MVVLLVGGGRHTFCCACGVKVGRISASTVTPKPTYRRGLAAKFVLHLLLDLRNEFLGLGALGFLGD